MNKRQMQIAIQDLGLMLLAVAGLSLNGCQSTHGRSFTTGLQSACEVTTPSAEAVNAIEAAPSMEPSAGGAQKNVAGPEQVVTHFPLYFEDPSEVRQEESSEVAWSGRDHAYILVGPFRFLVNLGLAPVSMVLEPPWREMASDGEASRYTLIWRCDAERYQAP